MRIWTCGGVRLVHDDHPPRAAHGRRRSPRAWPAPASRPPGAARPPRPSRSGSTGPETTSSAGPGPNQRAWNACGVPAPDPGQVAVHAPRRRGRRGGRRRPPRGAPGRRRWRPRRSRGPARPARCAGGARTRPGGRSAARPPRPGPRGGAGSTSTGADSPWTEASSSAPPARFAPSDSTRSSMARPVRRPAPRRAEMATRWARPKAPSGIERGAGADDQPGGGQRARPDGAPPPRAGRCARRASRISGRTTPLTTRPPARARPRSGATARATRGPPAGRPPG